jgi:hypothetical protein
MTNKDEIAALRAEVAALKEALSGKEDKPPPKSDFVPKPYQPIDWTARMSMPPSAIRAMVEAVPDSVKRGVIGDRHAPTGRPGMIPESQQQPSNVRSANVPGGTGWGYSPPISPPPGVAQADRLMDEQDRRDRAELAKKLGKG